MNYIFLTNMWRDYFSFNFGRVFHQTELDLSDLDQNWAKSGPLLLPTFDISNSMDSSIVQCKSRPWPCNTLLELPNLPKALCQCQGVVINFQNISGFYCSFILRSPVQKFAKVKHYYLLICEWKRLNYFKRQKVPKFYNNIANICQKKFS